MAGEAQDNVWPLPSFYFKVELGSLGEIALKRYLVWIWKPK